MDNKYSMKNVSLVKEVPEVQNIEQTSFSDLLLINDDLKYRILANLKGFIDDFMKQIHIEPILSVADLDDFCTSYRQNPAREGHGATLYNNLLWLFIFCRCLEPDIIVESGVYIGRSLWTLRKAAPQSMLYAFDINFKHLMFRDTAIEYKEMDWGQSDIKAKSENDFCYFDDHINNCLRIKQASEKGFKHLVFDDSPSVMNLHDFRFPGVPTAQMLLDNHIKEGDVITWKWKEKSLQYVHRDANTYAVGDLIDRIVVLPDLKKYTGREGSAHFVYVHLK
jgi:hypothetical protein